MSSSRLDLLVGHEMEVEDDLQVAERIKARERVSLEPLGVDLDRGDFALPFVVARLAPTADDSSDWGERDGVHRGQTR